MPSPPLTGHSTPAQAKASTGHVPVGQQLDEHLRLLYAQVTRNSAMDLKTILFVASNFRADPNKVKEVYNRQFAGLQKGLTRPQFISVMRQAMGRADGGDCSGMVDRARDVSRTFNILDAPSGGHALDELRASKARIFRASPRVPPSGPGPAGSAPISDASVTNSVTTRSPNNASSRLPAGGIGLFLGDASVPNTPLGNETSRFARGFVTPRRAQGGAVAQRTPGLAGSASFMPAYTNISMAAHRPKTSGDPGAIRKFSLQAAALASPRPMTGTGAMTRSLGGGGGYLQRPGTGSLAVGGELGSEVLWKLRAVVREEKMNRADLHQAFEHYDAAARGYVSLQNAVAVFAGLGMRREESEISAAAAFAQALRQDGNVTYAKLVAALVPVGGDAALNTLMVGTPVGSPLQSGKLTSGTALSLSGTGRDGPVMSSPRVPHDRMLPDKARTAMMVVRRMVMTQRDSVGRLEGEFGAVDSQGQGTCLQVRAAVIRTRT